MRTRTRLGPVHSGSLQSISAIIRSLYLWTISQLYWRRYRVALLDDKKIFESRSNNGISHLYRNAPLWKCISFVVCVCLCVYECLGIDWPSDINDKSDDVHLTTTINQMTFTFGVACHQAIVKLPTQVSVVGT